MMQFNDRHLVPFQSAFPCVQDMISHFTSRAVLQVCKMILKIDDVITPAAFS